MISLAFSFLSPHFLPEPVPGYDNARKLGVIQSEGNEKGLKGKII